MMGVSIEYSYNIQYEQSAKTLCSLKHILVKRCVFDFYDYESYQNNRMINKKAVGTASRKHLHRLTVKRCKRRIVVRDLIVFC